MGLFDVKLQGICDHISRDESLLLRAINGTSQWVTTLTHPCSKGVLKVREWNTSEGLTLFNWIIDGVTDFILSSDTKTLTFNVNFPTLSGINHVDGSTMLVPKNEYLATYSVKKDDCFKCSGTGIVNDITYNTLGKLNIVELSGKLSQILLKALLTEKGSNVEHPEFGSILATLIGKKLSSFTFIQLQESIQSCFAQIQSYQSAYADQLDPSEILLGVENITVSSNASDPRQIDVIIYYLDGNYDSQKISVQLVA